MNVQLFTVKDYDRGERPAQIRNGTLITSFHYFPGADFCFVGLDQNGITHLWRGNGRKNGKVNSMPTDLVKIVQDPAVSVFYLAALPSGGFYAGHDLAKLKAGITLASVYSIYRFEINFNKMVINEWQFLETVKMPKK